MLTALFQRLFRRAPSAGLPTFARGGAGETLAAEFLAAQGFTVVARNWRNPADLHEEIDLVCRDGTALVFVEVKARAAGALVPGYYAVDKRKRRTLRSAGAAYLRSLRPPPDTFRLDVVEVEFGTDGKPVIRHFANIPLFTKHWRP